MIQGAALIHCSSCPEARLSVLKVCPKCFNVLCLSCLQFNTCSKTGRRDAAPDNLRQMNAYPSTCRACHRRVHFQTPQQLSTLASRINDDTLVGAALTSCHCCVCMKLAIDHRTCPTCAALYCIRCFQLWQERCGEQGVDGIRCAVCCCIHSSGAYHIDAFVAKQLRKQATARAPSKKTKPNRLVDGVGTTQRQMKQKKQSFAASKTAKAAKGRGDPLGKQSAVVIIIQRACLCVQLVLKVIPFVCVTLIAAFYNSCSAVLLVAFVASSMMLVLSAIGRAPSCGLFFKQVAWLWIFVASYWASLKTSTNFHLVCEGQFLCLVNSVSPMTAAESLAFSVHANASRVEQMMADRCFPDLRLWLRSDDAGLVKNAITILAEVAALSVTSGDRIVKMGVVPAIIPLLDSKLNQSIQALAAATLRNVVASSNANGITVIRSGAMTRLFPLVRNPHTPFPIYVEALGSLPGLLSTPRHCSLFSKKTVQELADLVPNLAVQLSSLSFKNINILTFAVGSLTAMEFCHIELCRSVLKEHGLKQHYENILEWLRSEKASKHLTSQRQQQQLYEFAQTGITGSSKNFCSHLFPLIK